MARSIENHYLSILNFLNNRSNNASAESFNAKKNAFRASLRGVRDTTFFLFRLAKDKFAGEDLDDVLNMVPLLNNIDRADTSRIGMWGMSRGGLMTYMALTKTNVIKAAVVVSGLADLKQGVETQVGTDTMFYNWLPEYRTDKATFLKKRSAIAVADKICKTTPIFIIQGTGDGAVTAPQVFDMTRKLYELKHPFRFALFEGGGHGVGEFEDEVTRQTKNFFDNYLRDKKKWPSLELHR